jgi:nitrate/TMAO reductase-like tetraheme cytochrome c subunit
MKNFAAALPLIVLPIVLVLPAHADDYRVQKNAALEEECGSCHMVYPPQMLDSNSWLAVMSGLPKHFGSDASIDEKRRATITDFLVANSGSRKTGTTRDAQGKPLLRITQTARFEKKHREIPPATWNRAAIKSPANCTACHAEAEAGNYSEHSVRIPR